MRRPERAANRIGQRIDGIFQLEDGEAEGEVGVVGGREGDDGSAVRQVAGGVPAGGRGEAGAVMLAMQVLILE